MKKQTVNSIKLGLFVLAALILLIAALYALGKNRNLFGGQILLKTQFRDVNGLVVGNIVRFSGIDVGTVEKIALLSDTVIEVTLNVEVNMKNIIRTNALASLGTDGLIGNRVVNISPTGSNAPFVAGGELLPSEEDINTQAMLRTLSHTNESVAVIAEELRLTVQRINSSVLITRLLSDETLPDNLQASLRNLRAATNSSAVLMDNAVSTLRLASEGDGPLATLLTDTTLSADLHRAVQQLRKVEASAQRLVEDMDAVVASVDKGLNEGQGPANAMLSDSLMTARIQNSLGNLEQGTAAFNESMEALKHNFLFRRYFRKMEKAKQKAEREKQSPGQD